MGLRLMLILGALGSQVQAPATPTPTPLLFGAAANIVRVDIVASDKRGRVVSDLRAEEFEIEFDGKRFSPSVAQFVNLAERGPAPAPDGESATRRALAFMTAFPVMEGT